jgi:RNA recognition motif-containing protein
MKLFVGNLPYAATEADVTDFFTQAGVTVDSVNVMRDRFTGEARGFGFVEIHDDAAANRAIEACNGRDLMGRALVVNEARPMIPRERGGGGGGERRGGGGGGRSRDRY